MGSFLARAPEASDGRKTLISSSFIRTPPPSFNSWAAAYHDSAALELRLALFLERLYAFICIVRHEHAPDRFALDGEPKVERPAIALRDRKLGMADRDARAGGELGGVLDRARTARGRVGKEPVDDAGFFRARRVERGGVGDQVQAPGQPDQAGQPLRAARPGNSPRFTSGSPIWYVPSAANRRSQASASSRPPPRQWPAIAAMNTSGVFSILRNDSCASKASMKRDRGEPATNTETSAPAEKNFSDALVTTIADRMVESMRASSIAAENSRRNA